MKRSQILVDRPGRKAGRQAQTVGDHVHLSSTPRLADPAEPARHQTKSHARLSTSRCETSSAGRKKIRDGPNLPKDWAVAAENERFQGG
jgi:hypothetical protein